MLLSREDLAVEPEFVHKITTITTKMANMNVKIVYISLQFLNY